jgi:eukaryotic-like serine/threonine-protein kinase
VVLLRFVAPKFLPEEVARDRMCSPAFDAKRRLHRRQIIPTFVRFRHRRTGGKAFIVIEFLNGLTLKHRIGGKPIEIESNS